MKVLVLALVLAGCARAARPPVLDGSWPATTASFDEVSETWTRSARIRGGYQLVAELHATLKSPEWRAAWVARQSAHGRLGPAERAELEAEQRAAAEAAWEVQLVLTTWDRGENDLDRGERSVWRVVLVDADGNEIDPIEIKRDRRPDNVIRAEFPGYGDFARAYVAKFPPEAKILAPGVARVGLKLSSPRGGLELQWEAAAAPAQ